MKCPTLLRNVAQGKGRNAISNSRQRRGDGAECIVKDYAGLKMPIVIIAGEQDRLIDINKQSARLHRGRVPGVGHMVHQSATDAVMAAIDEAAPGNGKLRLFDRKQWIASFCMRHVRSLLIPRPARNIPAACVIGRDAPASWRVTSSWALGVQWSVTRCLSTILLL
jgi:hypothetical protein